MNEEGKKYDAGKAPIGLIPSKALTAIAEVLAFGAARYGAHNWRAGLAWSRLYDAALRHILAWKEGEDLDPESSLSHLAHASCCLMFLLELIKTRPDLDDRYKGQQP